MELSVHCDIDSQIRFIHDALNIAKGLKEKCLQLEKEKMDAQNKCLELQAKIDRLSSEKCSKCTILLSKINKERKEREMVKKEVKATLLKSIAQTLANLEDANTNQMTNAHQMFTELVCGGLVESPEREESKPPTLIQDSEVLQDDNHLRNNTKWNNLLSDSERLCNVENQKSEKLKGVSGTVVISSRDHGLLNSSERKPKKSLRFLEENSENKQDERILVNETIQLSDSENSTNDAMDKPYEEAIVVPETEAFPIQVGRTLDMNNRFAKPLKREKGDKIVHSKENNLPTIDESILPPVPKKMKCSSNRSKMHLQLPQEADCDQTLVTPGTKSPSLLSEVLDDGCQTRNQRTNGLSKAAGENNVNAVWRMKPSVLVESNASLTGTGAGPGKRLKQMTLSLSRSEKTSKHDVSMAEGFRGGLTDHGGEDRDVILPSPEQDCKRNLALKNVPCGSLDDPDLTVFHPVITSTCLPVDSSFDRLPMAAKSPPYKYRRDTVRKRKEREKLPGQECDECARYYEVAGLDKTQDLKLRMNTCSRHRDKYEIRLHTPPGFWDPVIPESPVEERVFVMKP